PRAHAIQTSTSFFLVVSILDGNDDDDDDDDDDNDELPAFLHLEQGQRPFLAVRPTENAFSVLLYGIGEAWRWSRCLRVVPLREDGELIPGPTFLQDTGEEGTKMLGFNAGRERWNGYLHDYIRGAWTRQ
ncbi:hypothetical protein MKZ38_007240, partial [Zalerion maritima]